MGLFDRLRGKKFTTADLAEIKKGNTKSVSGSINTLGAGGNFGPAFSEGRYSFDDWTFMAVSVLKNWQTEKFEYEGLPDELPVAELERLLFFGGKCAIFKTPAGYRVSAFSADSFDFYGNPRIITPVVSNRKYNIKPLTVGENAVIITNDNSFLFNKTPVFGTLGKIWGLLDTTRTAFLNVKRNLITSRQGIKVSALMSDDNINKLGTALKTDSLILPIDNTFTTNLRTRGVQNELGFSFDDKTASVGDNYYNCGDVLKTSIGIKSNANSKKKERQITDEIAINNEISNSQLSSMLLARKTAIKELNRVFGLSASVKIRDTELETNNGERPQNNEPTESDKN